MMYSKIVTCRGAWYATRYFNEITYKNKGGKLMKKIQAKLAIIIAIAFGILLFFSTSAQATLQTVR